MGARESVFGIGIGNREQEYRASRKHRMEEIPRNRVFCYCSAASRICFRDFMACTRTGSLYVDLPHGLLDFVADDPLFPKRSNSKQYNSTSTLPQDRKQVQ